MQGIISWPASQIYIAGLIGPAIITSLAKIIIYPPKCYIFKGQNIQMTIYADCRLFFIQYYLSYLFKYYINIFFKIYSSKNVKFLIQNRCHFLGRVNNPLLLNISSQCFWCFWHLFIGGYYQGCLLFWWFKVKVAPQDNTNSKI